MRGEWASYLCEKRGVQIDVVPRGKSGRKSRQILKKVGASRQEGKEQGAKGTTARRNANPEWGI